MKIIFISYSKISGPEVKKNRAINASKDLHTSYFLHDNKKHQGKNQKARLFKNFAWGVVYYYCGFFFGV